jgi:uracil-DNA glycosylase
MSGADRTIAIIPRQSADEGCETQHSMARLGENEVDSLKAQINACRTCVGALPGEPRPLVQFGETARVLVIGQAPGSKAHAGGRAWSDDSGNRLRQWLAVEATDFYDSAKFALVGMGFCYPGKANGGDLPPRRECAPLWHDRVFSLLPSDRLTLLVGSHAHAYYLPRSRQPTLGEMVRGFDTFGPHVILLPRPAWRVAFWMKKNPWFELEVIPALQAAVRKALAGDRPTTNAT